MSNKIQECLWKRKAEPDYYSPYKKREMIQRDFVRSVYGELFFIEALDLYKELEGHHGCVNSLFWSTRGDKLLSGSDDQTVRIWYPFEDYSLNNQVIQTGHRGNIFSAKFMPHTSDSIIVTAAADSEVRIFDLNASSHLSHVYTCHSDPVKRIGINNTSPYEFLTCSEDGTVRHFDTRLPHICTPHIVRSFATADEQWSRHYTTQHRNISPRPLQYKCSKPLLDYSQYGLDINSMTVNKLRPHYFAIAGMDDYMYLHDMRMIGQSNADAQAGKNIDMSLSSGRSKCVRRFRPTRPENRRVKRSNNYVTACKFSDANGDELIGNWAGEGVYLFNIFDSPSEPRYMETTFQEPASSKSHSQYFESILQPLIDLRSNHIEDTSLPSLFTSTATTGNIKTSPSSTKSFYKLTVHYRSIIIDEIECGLYPLALRHINDYYIELKYHCQLHLQSEKSSSRKETIQLNHAWLYCMRAIIFARRAIEKIMSTEKSIEQEDEKNFIPYLDRILLLKNSDEFSAVRTQMMKAKKYAPHNWRGLWCIASAYWLICCDYEIMFPSHRDTMMDDNNNNNNNKKLHSSSPNDKSTAKKSQQQQQQRQRKGRNLSRNILTEYLHKVHRFSEQAILLLQKEITKLKKDGDSTPTKYVHLQSIIDYQECLNELLMNSKIALLDMVNLGDNDAKLILEKINKNNDDDEEDSNDDDDEDNNDNDDAMSGINYALLDEDDDDDDDADNNNNNKNNNDDDNDDDDEDEKIDWFRSLYPPSASWLPSNIEEKRKRHRNHENMDEDENYSSSSSSDIDLRHIINVQEVDISDDDDDIDDIDDIVLLHNLQRYRHDNHNNAENDHDDDSNDPDSDSDDGLSHNISIGRRISYTSSGQLEEDDSFFRSDEDSSDALDDLHGLDDLERQQDVLRRDLEYEADVIGHRKKYAGHSNLKTIKDVNFYGGQDEYIVSGSDDGCCFIWEKKTAKIVQVLQADQDIVNIVQGHPSLPIMAVSGIDDTIKIFKPTANIHTSQSSKMNQLAEVIQGNHQTHVRQRTEAFLTRSLLESMTRASRQYLIITEDDDDDDDDDDDIDDDDDDSHHGDIHGLRNVVRRENWFIDLPSRQDDSD